MKFIEALEKAYRGEAEGIKCVDFVKIWLKMEGRQLEWYGPDGRIEPQWQLEPVYMLEREWELVNPIAPNPNPVDITTPSRLCFFAATYCG